MEEADVVLEILKKAELTVDEIIENVLKSYSSLNTEKHTKVLNVDSCAAGHAVSKVIQAAFPSLGIKLRHKTGVEFLGYQFVEAGGLEICLKVHNEDFETKKIKKKEKEKDSEVEQEDSPWLFGSKVDSEKVKKEFYKMIGFTPEEWKQEVLNHALKTAWSEDGAYYGKIPYRKAQILRKMTEREMKMFSLKVESHVGCGSQLTHCEVYIRFAETRSRMETGSCGFFFEK